MTLTRTQRPEGRITNGELIALLQQFSPDLPVVLCNGSHGSGFKDFRPALSRSHIHIDCVDGGGRMYEDHDSGVWMERPGPHVDRDAVNWPPLEGEIVIECLKVFG